MGLFVDKYTHLLAYRPAYLDTDGPVQRSHLRRRQLPIGPRLEAPDLDAGFSAAAARAASLSLVPVIGAMEVGVRGGLERCVRVLMHIYTSTSPEELRHVYLKDARSLPSDLPE